jgi:RimJ/RimL family protein N-acetyltransferase
MRLVTARLVLREFAEDDWPALNAFESDSEAVRYQSDAPRTAAACRATGEQVAESAVWAGVRSRSDLVAGRALGRGVGQILFDRIKNDA